MRVKICGITTLEDAFFSIKSGADALGFVFYEKSSRYITPQKVKEIVTKLPPFIDKVGLFVNETPQNINLTCKVAKLTIAQIHFEVDENFLSQLEVPYLRVVRARKKEDIQNFNDEYRIVDAYVDNFGGEGKRVEISWFDDIDTSKIILAGGLNIDVLEEIKKYNFFGVDVSSGVEAKKGIKDHKKIEEFIKRAKL